MPTSGTYTWSGSRDFVITEAFKKINALGNFETLDTPRLNDGINALNPLVKHLATMGMPLWAIDELTIPFSTLSTVGGASIGLGQSVNSVAPLKVLQALRKDTTTGYDVPMTIYTYEDYENLSNKAANGAPISLFYQPKGAVGALKVWLLPDSYWQTNGSLYIRYQRPFQDSGSATDTPDFPVEWHRTLILGLACDLAPNYGLDVTQRQQLEKKYKDSLDEILGFSGEEGSLFVHPTRRL